MSKITRLREAISNELELELIGDLPATNQEIREAWSAAARAAAAAARKGRGKGISSRSRLARSAFKKAGGTQGGALTARVKRLSAQLSGFEGISPSGKFSSSGRKATFKQIASRYRKSRQRLSKKLGRSMLKTPA